MNDCVYTKGPALSKSGFFDKRWTLCLGIQMYWFNTRPKVLLNLALANDSVMCNKAWKHIKAWRVTDRNKHVHFALPPFSQTLHDSLHWFQFSASSLFISPFAIAVISHSVPWRFFFSKHCRLYFNYQYSGGASLPLPRCSCFPVAWQPIALTAAINWFCCMLLSRFRSITEGKGEEKPYITEASIFVLISVIAFPRTYFWIAQTMNIDITPLKEDFPINPPN